MNWPHFSREELKCPCCGECHMDPVFMAKLEALREACGFPFVVNSAFRCDVHNAAVGGGERSAHLEGLAVDIAADGRQAYRLITAAAKFGIWGIGVGRGFVHLDGAPALPDRPRPWVWTY